MRNINISYVSNQGQNTSQQILQIVNDFFSSSKIKRNNDTEKMLEYLLQPKSVYRMIVASDFELPALTFVVKELEEEFNDCANAPLNHKGQYQNAVNRQNIGRMVKYIMREFGYVPIDGKRSERARLPKFSGSEFFSTSAVYAKKIK